MARSINGRDYPLLSEAIRGGLFHPNCRHGFDLWIEGVSVMPKPLDGEKNKRQAALEAKQRALERNIRKMKRLKEGSFSKENKEKYARKLKDANAALRNFLKEHASELRRDAYRTKTYGMTE